MICGVYEIWIGNYFYQGSSKDIKKRMYQHLYSLKKGDHCNIYMQNVYNKYKSFEWKTLVECDDRDLAYKYETDFIEANYGLKNYLNVTKTIGCTFKHGCNIKLSFAEIQKLCPFPFIVTDDEDEE